VVAALLEAEPSVEVAVEHTADYVEAEWVLVPALGVVSVEMTDMLLAAEVEGLAVMGRAGILAVPEALSAR
jgi:hypothetical protein